MTRRNVLYAAAALIVIVLVALSFVQFLRQQEQQSSSADSTESSDGAEPSTPEPGVSDPTEANGQVPEVEPSDQEAPPSIADAALNQQVEALIEAYYLILPSDNASIRRDRVTSLNLVSAEAMQMLTFELNPEEVQYQRYGLIQQGMVNPQTVTARLADESGQTYLVSVPVELVWSRNGSPAGSDIIYTIAVWQIQDNIWSMTSFSPEGGG